MKTSLQRSTAAVIVPTATSNQLVVLDKSQLQFFLVALLFLLFRSSSASAAFSMNDCDDDQSQQHCRQIVLPDPVLLEEIVQVPGPFQDAEEEENCRVCTRTVEVVEDDTHLVLYDMPRLTNRGWIGFYSLHSAW
jgi:hypothetical protein